MGLIAQLVVAIIAGWLAGQLVKGRGFGVIGDLVLGLLGGLLGSFLFGRFYPGAGLVGAILVSTIGAVVLVAIVRLIRRV